MIRKFRAFRQLFLLLFLFGGSAFESPAQPPSPTASPTGAERSEIWIALRQDGRPGRGSQADPFDGSTSQKLDAVLRKALDTAGMRVHLGPGTYYTRGMLAADPVYIRQRGIMVLGAGMYRTTLALDPAVGPILPPWSFSVLQTDQQITPDSHLTVQDLTLDTNWPNLVKPRRDIAIGNVSLIGNYCSLIRVRGLNAHGDDASGKEGFALTIGCGGNYDIHDALIADCIVESPRGDYVNGITLVGWAFDVYPATKVSGVVRGCRVRNFRADHRHMAAYAIAGGVLADCEAENSTIGVYMEYARDLTITNCELRNNTWRGVWAFPVNNYGGIRNLKVLNSTIEASNFLNGASCIEVASGDEKNSTESALISGNSLLYLHVRSGHKAYSINSSPGVSSMMAIGNRIDRRLDNSELRSSSTIGNRSRGGGVLRAMPNVIVAGPDTRFLPSPEKKRRRKAPSQRP